MHFSILTRLLPSLTLAHPSPKPATWQSLTPIPLFPRQEHTTLFLPPSTIAILGGIILDATNTSFPPVNTTSMMQFYSIDTNTWSSRSDMPVALNHLNAAVVGGKIYVLGGLVEGLDERGRAWRAEGGSWVYDPECDEWSAIPNLPKGEERGSAAVGVHGDKIVLAGGLTDLEFYGEHVQTSVGVVSVFDTKTLEWEDVPEEAKYIPEARDHAGAAAVEGKMYVLGGRDNGQENLKDTVFVLDLACLEKGWEVSEAKMPTARGGVSTGVVGRKVYTFGGEGDKSVETGVFDEVEAYDTVKDTWESVGTMKIPRHGTYAVGVKGKVYIPGGGIMQGGGPVADFDAFVL
jgi:N-acetylneuraminic acid mutarotase